MLRTASALKRIKVRWAPQNAWEGIHLDQVAIYSSPDVSEPVYSEIDAENVKLIQSEEDSEFYRVIIIEGEKEKAIGYIKEDDVVKFLENDED